jgi:hypothetical protein
MKPFNGNETPTNWMFVDWFSCPVVGCWYNLSGHGSEILTALVQYFTR